MFRSETLREGYGVRNSTEGNVLHGWTHEETDAPRVFLFLRIPLIYQYVVYPMHCCASWVSNTVARAAM